MVIAGFAIAIVLIILGVFVFFGKGLIWKWGVERLQDDVPEELRLSRTPKWNRWIDGIGLVMIMIAILIIYMIVSQLMTASG